jgi:zinc transporter, ZIP family
MSVWAALLWGLFSSGALLVGALLAGPMQSRPRLTAEVMAFGGGALLSAVAYELIPSASFEHGYGIGVGVLLGALVYYGGDRLLDGGGGDQRQKLRPQQTQGSGYAMFLGALLDGIPETFILGTSLALGGSISVAFVVAVFISNIPEGVAGTISLRAVGFSERKIRLMWLALVAVSSVMAAAGYVLANDLPHDGLYAEAFAAGAVVTMLADSMMPEAYEHGGKTVGLVTALGYIVAAVLSVAE